MARVRESPGRAFLVGLIWMIDTGSECRSAALVEVVVANPAPSTLSHAEDCRLGPRFTGARWEVLNLSIGPSGNFENRK
jgi:hypothetical protein